MIVPDNCARERSLNFTSTASTFDVGSFLRLPTTSHSHPHHVNSLPATKRSHTAPLPSQQGCGPSHRQRRESEGRESRGGPRKWEARSVRHENRGTTFVVPRFSLIPLSPTHC